MQYDPQIVAETLAFIRRAQEHGKEQEAQHGQHAGNRLAPAQTTAIADTINASEDLLGDTDHKREILTRFVQWAEHHGTKVPEEKYPYILRQLLVDEPRAHGHSRDKIAALIRGNLREPQHEAIVSGGIPAAAHRPPRPAPTPLVKTGKPPHVIEQTATLEEAQQFIDQTREAFSKLDKLLRFNDYQKPSPAVSEAIASLLHAAVNSVTKITLLQNFERMLARSDTGYKQVPHRMIIPVTQLLAEDYQDNKDRERNLNNLQQLADGKRITSTVQFGKYRRLVDQQFPALSKDSFAMSYALNNPRPLEYLAQIKAKLDTSAPAGKKEDNSFTSHQIYRAVIDTNRAIAIQKRTLKQAGTETASPVSPPATEVEPGGDAWTNMLGRLGTAVAPSKKNAR